MNATYNWIKQLEMITSQTGSWIKRSGIDGDYREWVGFKRGDERTKDQGMAISVLCEVYKQLKLKEKVDVANGPEILELLCIVDGMPITSFEAQALTRVWSQVCGDALADASILEDISNFDTEGYWWADQIIQSLKRMKKGSSDPWSLESW